MEKTSLNRWLLLIYKIPRKPTAGRVYVWRKLRKLGALLLHDAVWVLPANSRTEEQLQWLANEIKELGGEAILWHSQSAINEQDDALVHQFQQQTESAYRGILLALKRKKPDLPGLSRTYREVQSQDYFPSELSKHTQEALLAAERRSQG